MSIPPDPTARPATTTRRTLLRGAGWTALAGAALLEGCAAGEEGGTGAPTPPPSSPTASRTPRPSLAKGSPSGANAAIRDVPVGGGVILTEADYLITQPSEGVFRAFSRFCTHQRCPLASIGGGLISCICHSSRFSIADGSVQGGPATKPLTAVPVKVVGDRVEVVVPRTSPAPSSSR